MPNPSRLVTQGSVGGDGFEGLVEFEPAQFGFVDLLGELGLALEELGHLAGVGAGVQGRVGEAPKLLKRQAELSEKIDEAELRWLELHEALEAIPAD